MMNPVVGHPAKLLRVNFAAKPGANLAKVRAGLFISRGPGQPCGGGSCGQAAFERREGLGRGLLNEYGIKPADSRSAQALADLDAVLAADYCEAPGFPSGEFARELPRIVRDFIVPYEQIWNCWQDRQNLTQLTRVFNWGEVVIRAEPYVDGAGLSLWGFSTDSRVRGRTRRLVFVNTAHDSGAVAATIGHELGHYIFASLADPRPCERTSKGSMFAHHLKSEEELFCDAVVAMSAYSHGAVSELVRSIPRADVPGRLRAMLGAVNPHYRIDFRSRGLTPPWRIRYFTLMAHLSRLRCALLETAGV